MVKTYATTKVKVDKESLVSVKDYARLDVSKETKPLAAPTVLNSVNSERPGNSEASSDAKNQKRPAPLPLPALALFLKQHSAKTKKAKLKTETSKETQPENNPMKGPKVTLASTKDKLKSPETRLEFSHNDPQTESNLNESKTEESKQELHSTKVFKPKSYPKEAPKPESLSTESKSLGSCKAKEDSSIQEFHAAKVQKPVPHSRKVAKSKSRRSKVPKRESYLRQRPPNSPSQDSTTEALPEALCSAKLPSTKHNSGLASEKEHFMPSLQQKESNVLQAVLSLGPVNENIDSNLSVLSNSNSPFCILETSTISPTPITTTSSKCWPQLGAVLPVSDSSHTQESCTLPTESSPLPDPECSSFGYEPLSPASSPEALPAIPGSLALDLEPADTAEVDLEHRNNSSDVESSVFKWHTVLPPQEQCEVSPFTAFPPSPQLPSPSITPSVMPSQTDTTLPSEPLPPSFQESEQSLPFPGELSPLALQLPLSPTFSSLDGDALSPTPSITDLVHFFSTADDDLGIGVEFSNTNAVTETITVQALPLDPGLNVDPQTQETTWETQSVPPSKPQQKTKRKKRRRLPKEDLDFEVDNPSYSVMKPSLEEVEEQLFISFTSKVTFIESGYLKECP